MKKEHLIPVISSVVLCCILLFFKTHIFTPEVPDTLIGITGLEEAIGYLTKLIISDIVFALLIALAFFFSFGFYYYKLYSSEGEKISKKYLVISISMCLALGLCTTSVPNKLDKQCEIIGTSKYGLTKSIVLLNRVNTDLKENQYISQTVSHPKVSEETYYYSSGRSRFSEKEYCFKSDNKTLISQVSDKDALILKMMTGKSEEVNCEIFSESRFLKSVQGLDNFTLSEKIN